MSIPCLAALPQWTRCFQYLSFSQEIPARL